MNKKCSKCLIIKDLNQFYSHTNTVDKKRSECK